MPKIDIRELSDHSDYFLVIIIKTGKFVSSFVNIVGIFKFGFFEGPLWKLYNVVEADNRIYYNIFVRESLIAAFVN